VYYIADCIDKEKPSIKRSYYPCGQSIEILDWMNEHYFSSEEPVSSFRTEAKAIM